MGLRIITVFFSSIIVLILLQYTASARPLQGETAYHATLRSSLQKGPVPSSGNPCTGTPGKRSGICKLAEKSFAGTRLGAHPPSLPDLMTVGEIRFGVAPAASDKTDQKAAHQKF